MSDINPYESPRAIEPMVVAELGEPEDGGVWRQGNLLVMHKRSTLPDRCVKSNQPAHGRKFKRRLYWHHPVIYLAIPLGLLGYIVLAVVFQKDAVIHIGLSPERISRRRSMLLIAWSLGIGSILLVVVGLASLREIGGLMAWAGVVGFLVAVICERLAPSGTVSAKRITKDYVWLKGVHPDYLAELPEWPNPA